MTLFWGLFSRLAAQALIAALIVAAMLVWSLRRQTDEMLRARDLAQLQMFVDAVGSANSYAPLPKVIGRLQQNLPDHARGRIAVFGKDLSGYNRGAAPSDGPGPELPIQVNGASVATARIVVAPALTSVDRQHLIARALEMTIAAAAMFVTLLITAAAIARRWTRPQRDLYAFSQAIAEGHYEDDFVAEGPRETRATMRNMHRIAQRFDRLETARRTWLVTVAGELRHPVANLAERIAGLGSPDPKMRQESFNGLGEDQRQLDRIAEDLHAVALADLGRLPVHFATTDPRALIHNAVWSNGSLAKAAGVTLETANLPEYTIPVKWDAERIEQLFGALIQNSLHYTPRGGRIVLGLAPQRGAWELIVDDSAPGVDVELAQRLFEPFYRVGGSEAGSATDSGLGLATARAIVEAHHGRIEAENSPIGGLRVIVTLPSIPSAV